jgi:hypothetical protein
MGSVSEQMTVKYRVIRVTLILLLATANMFEICVLLVAVVVAVFLGLTVTTYTIVTW